MTTAGNGNRAHRLWQGSCCQLAVLQHFQAGRNLRNYHLVQTALWHILTSSNSIRYIFNNGILGYSHILACQVLWLLSLFILASNQLISTIGIGSNLYIKTAGLSKSYRQHIGNGSIQIAALEGCISIHSTLKLLNIYLQAFLSKIALFLGNDNWHRINIWHNANRNLLQPLLVLSLSAKSQQHGHSHY